MLYFTADYADREKLLRLGAKWDFSRWQWYVENPHDYKTFAQWIGRIVTNRLYIIKRAEECPFCGSEIKLSALACGEYYEDFLPRKFGAGYINILKNFSAVTVDLPANEFNAENRCSSCNGTFSDEYLFGGADSPFYIDNEERAQGVTIYRADFDCDIPINGKIVFSFAENIFKNCPATEIIGQKP